MEGGLYSDEIHDGLDDVYHSNSMHEMKVKADLHNIDLYDKDALVFLIDATTYHHAFWPHTAKRFTAFKALLKTMRDLPEKDCFDDVVNVVKSEIAEYEADKWRRSTPGGKQEIKNLKQVLRILEKLENNCNDKQ